MTEKLTIKQENFAQKYVELGNASEAYRQSYDAGNMADKTIWEAACRVLADSKVSARVFRLQEAAAAKHEITVDDLVKELEEARDLAIETKQSSSMVSATLGKGKLLGFDKSRLEVTGNLTLSETLASTDEPNSNEVGEE